MKGSEIKKRRVELGLTQNELAMKLGMSARSIINYEKGGVIPATKNDMLKEFFSSGNKDQSLEGLIYNRIESRFKTRLDKIEEVQKLLQDDFVRVFKIVLHKETISSDNLTRKKS